MQWDPRFSIMDLVTATLKLFNREMAVKKLYIGSTTDPQMCPVLLDIYIASLYCIEKTVLYCSLL